MLDLKASEDKGQVLQQDQVIAVKKLDGVVEMIDILKDINKSVSDSLTEVIISVFNKFFEPNNCF